MKRGSSGLSLIVGIRKPVDFTSHDVVNRVRRIMGEKRVGHTGTLDPMATGVLPICIGPATRLDKYMVGHDKTYRATITFGSQTNTDDAKGEVVKQAFVPTEIREKDFALGVLRGLVGIHMQVPPAFCAVKINGQPAYKRMRAGEEVELEARQIEVYSAELVNIIEASSVDGLIDSVSWIVDLSVSKGTFIRSIARDLGQQLGTCAHLSGLARMSAGRISLDECVSLETLEDLKESAALDPVRVLGFRFAYADERADSVSNGAALSPDDVTLYESLASEADESLCACCATELVKSQTPPFDGELICVLVENTLKGVYRYDSRYRCWKSECVFAVGVSRG